MRNTKWKTFFGITEIIGKFMMPEEPTFTRNYLQDLPVCL
jgi:hypothetical protein